MEPRISRTFKALLLLTGALFSGLLQAQTGTEFWVAPPEVTVSHGDQPIYINVTTLDDPAVVTISQPANAAVFNGGAPIVLNVPAHSAVRRDVTSLKAQLETRPTNTVLNTGLHISSTADITCYYEASYSNNPDIMPLKGRNGLGLEFYIPLHKHAPFYNNDFGSGDKAYASFDIVATENNTEVMIYSPTPVDGHAALTAFTVILNRGQTYSCGWTGANYIQPATHPSGAVVLSNKPVAISLKDDSNHNPSGGCYDLMLDQIVPVNILGTDYVAIKGQLNATGDESLFLMAVENNTKVYIDGNATPVATLFAGQYYRHDMDGLVAPITSSYAHTSKPVYAIHVTGFGCEQGMAILPPLNCAGSRQVGFTRSTSEGFFLNLLVRSGSQDDFVVAPATAAIPASAFNPVPGTAGEWMAARIQFNTTQIPVGGAFVISNSTDVFSLAVINGGAGSGCRYGFFSEFAGEILVDAGVDQTLCVGDSVTLVGSVAGGSTTGEWTSTGSGTFLPDPTAMNAVYVPSIGDQALGSVTLTLTSTGHCTPRSDQMVVTFQEKAIVNAGPDLQACTNNPSVTLSGEVLNAVGGVWTAVGGGTFLPNNSNMAATFTPTPAQLASGSVLIRLTSNGNGVCPAVEDTMRVTFTPSPTVNAGVDQSLCSNNATAHLSAAITVATGVQWTGGTGMYTPGSTAQNITYAPSPTEIANGYVTLTATTTGMGNCGAVNDQVTLTFTASPTANAGPDASVSSNNANVSLNGSVTIATGGQWSGGLGTFNPGSAALNATYSPTAAEIAAGSLTLTLTTTGNGTCSSANDQMTIVFTAAPTSNAGPDQVICANNAATQLNGAVTVATGGIWTGGSGTYNPSNNALNAIYTPSAGELSAGSVTLTLTTVGNGNSNPVSDQVVIVFTGAPHANAGPDITVCANLPNAQLGGSITNASGGIWSGGSGSFSPSNTSLSAVYQPTLAEIAAGTVTLTLTTTGIGNCAPHSDQIVIHISPAPTVNAGADLTSCGNNAAVTLAGSVTNATGGIWSGGTGVFSPSITALGAVYTPSTNEITAGTVTLTLTSTGNGICNAVSDQVMLVFSQPPTVEAGANITVCRNAPAAVLNGSVTIATGGAWSGGGGTFAPNNTALNATYTPSAAELALGTVTLTLTSTGNGNCNPVSDQVTITINPAPVVDAGAALSVCSNNANVQLGGSVSGAGGGQWSGGAGSFTPSITALNAVYHPTAGEIAAGSMTLTLTTIGNGYCVAVSDQVQITFTPPPTAEAGNGGVRCANNASIQLNGSVTIANGGAWSGAQGTFSPNANTLNAVYAPSAGEIAQGYVTLTLTTTGNNGCTAVSDNVTFTFTPAPTVNAGPDATTCANNAYVDLSGSITVATGALWSGGSGTYSNGTSALVTRYTPSAAEIAAGSVTLTLTSVGNGICNAVSDQIVITINPAPVVDAGAALASCANSPSVVLAGTVQNATGGVWSGSGTFTPSANNLNATYTPTAAQIAAGSAIITLTSTGNGLCNAVNDQVTLTITEAPVVNAGVDQVLCANNADVTLHGTVLHATGGSWSGGLGAFAPNNTSLNTIYTPTAGELAAGSVRLILTSTGNGGCIATTDTMRVTFTPAPTVNAGVDASVCANAASVTLNGAITVASGGVWTGGTGTFSPSNSALNATYTPSMSEISAGAANLVLTTTGNGNCTAVQDAMHITIAPVPVVNAGPDVSVCRNNATFTLNGFVGNAPGAVWTGGAGTFFPSNTATITNYTPTAAELAAGSLTLTLSSTGTTICSAMSDGIVITFTDGPTANAGADLSVCANAPVAQLNGSVTNANGGTWSGGAGTFSPSANVFSPTYTPTAAERAAGTVTLTLTTTGNGNCLAANDAVVITITPAPTVNTGADATVCANAPQVTLGGSFTVATGATWSGGAGTYLPNANTLNAVYTPSLAEIAAGSVTLTLTSTGNGLCTAVNDAMVITVTAAPVVNAGVDQTNCANDLTVALSGSVTGTATTGIWSTSGTGHFTPSPSVLNATYVASSADSLAGGVTLTLTHTGNSLCAAVSDAMQFNILPSAIAGAGADQTICGTGTSIVLAGSITGNATQGAWTTTGTGTFQPGPAVANAQYVLSAGDRTAGTLTFTWSVNSCDNAMDQMVLTVVPPSQVNAGPDQVACSNNLNFLVNGQVSGASTTGKWSSLGTGSFTNAPNALANIYHASAADSLAGGVYLVLNSTGTGVCQPTADTLYVQILPNASVNAGADQTYCANNVNVQLNGVLNGNLSSTVWSTNGTGTFNPGPDALNATYVPSSVDTALHNITLTLSAVGSCNNASDAMQLTLTPAPYVNAGADQTFCNLVDQFTLTGVISGVTGTGFWSTTGSGTFVDATAMTTTYMASPADVSAGQIDIYLTSLNNGTCNAVTDRMSIYLSDGVLVNAGPDQTVCAVASSAQLAGTIHNGSPNGLWTTSGNGTFSPSPSALNAQYLFTSDDVANGTVVLTLASVASGSCPATQDQITLVFGNSSFAYAGADVTVCANDPHVTLNGQFSGGAVGSIWSSSGTGYFSNTTDPAASYTMSPADIQAGSVQITLTTVTSGTCAAVADVMTLSATPLPSLNVGADRVVCTADPVQLNANVLHAQGVTWTTSGTGSFMDNTALVTLYYPTIADSIAGVVELVALTNGSGPCSSVSDAMTITFGGGLSAEAGADVVTCSTEPAIALNAQVSGTSSGVWTTNGTGSFSPAATSLQATYNPGPADFIIGNINLVLTTTNNLGCPAGRDTVKVTYHLPPVVDAGMNVRLCNGLENVPLNGNVQHASTLAWTSSGTGTFSPSASVATASYLPSSADSLAGGVILTLTAQGTGGCAPTSDAVSIEIVPTRLAHAGADVDLCASGEALHLAGSLTGPGGAQWTTNGTGTFLPDANTLNAIYQPSATDLVFPQLQFTLTTTDNQGCAAHSDAMTLFLHQRPMANAGPDQSVCNASLDLSLSGTVVNATGGVWSTNGTGTFLPDATTLTAQYRPSVTDPLSGSIQLVLTTTGNAYCPATADTTVITFSNPMQPEFTMSGFCAGSPTQFADNSISGGAQVLAWNWTFSDGTMASGQQVSHVFTTAGEHNAVLTIISLNGCTSTIAHDLTIQEAPIAGFTAEGSLLMNEPVTFQDGSSGATTWHYTFGDGLGSSTAPTPIYTYEEDGRYMVVQTVTNAIGCTSRDSMIVTIGFNEILPPKLPNAFSPNGDGKNDVFFVRGGPFEEMHLVIYNSWGEMIFESNDPQFGWDGTYKGQPEMNGVYTYTVRAKTITGEEHVRPGKVTLIR